MTAERSVAAAHPAVGREYGVSRYERIRDADFAAADRYYERTRGYWQRVEDAWHADFAHSPVITLRGAVDQKGYFIPLFERADRIEESGPSPDDDATIRRVLDGMRAP